MRLKAMICMIDFIFAYTHTSLHMILPLEAAHTGVPNIGGICRPGDDAASRDGWSRMYHRP